MSEPTRSGPPVQPTVLTPAEHAALQKALLSVKSLPRSLCLVPVLGALEVWAKRRIPGGSRWVRVQRIPSPTSPGLAPCQDEVLTDFMPL